MCFFINRWVEPFWLVQLSHGAASNHEPTTPATVPRARVHHTSSSPRVSRTHQLVWRECTARNTHTSTSHVFSVYNSISKTWNSPHTSPWRRATHQRSIQAHKPSARFALCNRKHSSQPTDTVPQRIYKTAAEEAAGVYHASQTNRLHREPATKRASPECVGVHFSTYAASFIGDAALSLALSRCIEGLLSWLSLYVAPTRRHAHPSQDPNHCGPSIAATVRLYQRPTPAETL